MIPLLCSDSVVLCIFKKGRSNAALCTSSVFLGARTLSLEVSALLFYVIVPVAPSYGQVCNKNLLAQNSFADNARLFPSNQKQSSTQNHCCMLSCVRLIASRPGQQCNGLTDSNHVCFWKNPRFLKAVWLTKGGVDPPGTFLQS